MDKENQDYTFSFTTTEAPQKIFKALVRVRDWWTGFYGEEISGHSEKINDEFVFKAGDGMHYSRQKLIELVPDEKVSWLVTESNLSFLQHTGEWENTKISFEISRSGNKSQVTFTHHGLVPKIECYDNCSSAWAQYLAKLAARFN